MMCKLMTLTSSAMLFFSTSICGVQDQTWNFDKAELTSQLTWATISGKNPKNHETGSQKFYLVKLIEFYWNEKYKSLASPQIFFFFFNLVFISIIF